MIMNDKDKIECLEKQLLCANNNFNILNEKYRNLLSEKNSLNFKNKIEETLNDEYCDDDFSIDNTIDVLHNSLNAYYELLHFSYLFNNIEDFRDLMITKGDRLYEYD